jgi:hypothetical protein
VAVGERDPCQCGKRQLFRGERHVDLVHR